MHEMEQRRRKKREIQTRRNREEEEEGGAGRERVMHRRREEGRHKDWPRTHPMEGTVGLSEGGVFPSIIFSG